MIAVRCYNSLENAACLRNQVNALNIASARPDPFSTFEFYENFLRHDAYFPAGRGMNLWFLTAFIDDELVGYLALKQDTYKIAGLATSRISFMVTHDTDRPHLVARTEHQNPVSLAFYHYLLGRQTEWSFLEFQQQDNTSSLFPPPGESKLQRHLVSQWTTLDNGTIHLHWASLQDYFKALSKNFQRNIRRQTNRLLDAGNVELLSSSQPLTTPALFELYRSIEAHSWKSKANINISSYPRRIEYVKGLLDSQQPMRISIQVLLLDGVPIAGLICGSFRSGLYALHMVYDDELNHLAPGSTLMLLGMRRAIESHYAFFNLLSGFGYFKHRWLADITEARTAQIYRKGSLPYWHRMIGDRVRSVFSFGLNHAARLFNPLRRKVSEHSGQPSVPGHIPKPQRTAEERNQIAALIATIRAAEGEHLDMAALRAVMPFDAQPKAPGETNTATAHTVKPADAGKHPALFAGREKSAHSQLDHETAE